MITLNYLSKNTELPKKCETKYCGCTSKYWYQDSLTGDVYSNKCGSFIGRFKIDILPFKQRDDNLR